MAEVRVFGIRHHGPGSGRSVVRALTNYQPDVVLIEGPPEADDYLKYLPNLTPPVALLAWAKDDPSQAAFWPFAVFSPEWQAMSWAHQNQVDTQFIDLPAGISLNIEKELKQHSSDPLKLLAQAAGHDDPERWWEDIVEQRLDTETNHEQVFQVVETAMTAVRDDEDEDDEYSLIREAHMRKKLRAAMKKYQRVAVICGAYHVPALSGKLPAVSADNALLKGLKKTPVQLTWVPWSHGRLAAASGYGAGVDSPGWYHHIFTTENHPVASWLTHIGSVLRENDLPTSSAHIIEGVRLANTLAALRDRPMPGLSEVQEATLAVLCEGSDLALELVTREAVVGELLGEVSDDVPRTPLDTDLHAIAKRLRLKFDAKSKELDLDLRKPNELARSNLLRRLNILGIGWGEHQGKAGLGTFRELWTIKWAPEFSVAVVTASRWGNTVESAAAAKLLDETESLAEVTASIEKALVADLGSALPKLLRLLDIRAAAETDIAQLLDALPPLVRSYRYGDVRGTDVGDLSQVITGLLQRACVGLPVALSGLRPDAAEEMRDRINTANTAIGLLDEESQQLWKQTLLGSLERHDLPGLIAGRIVRMLFDEQTLDEEQVAQKMSLALSGGHNPDEQAAWAEGLLTGSSLLLLHNPALLKIIDGWIQGLSEETFIEILPVVRRAFGSWAVPERRSLASKVKRLDAEELNTQPDLDFTGCEEILASVDLILGVS
ncbi:MAG: hypothetical protein CR979_00445 [Propionibacterium sp.]|nr:MAG: hypothetical protein CR979_00445 [Propionibacterium sp.]